MIGGLRKTWGRMRDDAVEHSPSDRSATEVRIAEVDEFFAEDDRPGLAYQTLARILTFLATFSSAAWIILFAVMPSVEPRPTKAHPSPYTILSMSFDTVEKVVGVLGMLTTISVSLVASVIAVALINRVNLAKIRFIKDLAERGALVTVLRNLKGHRGKYSVSKHVELVFSNIKFSPTGDFAFVEVVQTVNVRMPFHRGSLILDFVRLDSESENPAEKSVKYDLHSDGVPDDAYSIDIASARKHFPSEFQDMFPGLVEVVVDSQPQSLEPKRTNGLDNHLRWTIDVRQHVGCQPVQVMYRYRYFQEAPGFASQQVSEPTHGFFYSLNYDNVAEHINVYQIGTLNAHESGQTVARSGAPLNQVEISTSGWVVPNALIVFCWYRKAGSGPAGAAPFPDRATRVLVAQADAAGGATRTGPDPGGVALPGNDLVDASTLDADGNCLGVALIDLFGVLGLAPPPADYAALRTTSDAVTVLKAVPGLRVAVLPPPGVGPAARLSLRTQAWWKGLRLDDDTGLLDGEVALGLRSMRQLYGLPSADGHWVVMAGTPPVLMDRLAEHVVGTYEGAVAVGAEAALAARGFTIKVRVA